MTSVDRLIATSRHAARHLRQSAHWLGRAGYADAAGSDLRAAEQLEEAIRHLEAERHIEAHPRPGPVEVRDILAAGGERDGWGGRA